MPRNKKIKTILVIRTTAMGDVAMTVPVVNQFMEQNSDVRIVFLTSSPFKPFFRYLSGSITIETADFHGVHSGFKGIVKLYKELSSKYDIDVILDLQVKLYSLVMSLLFKVFSGVSTIRLDKGKKDKKEITRRNNKIRRQLPKMLFRYADVFKSAGFDFDFKEIPYSHRETIPEKYSFLDGEKLIGVSPLASFEGKQLPLPLLRSVIERLIERLPEYKLLIFGGGRYEKMVGDSLESFYKGHVFSTIGKMNISLEMDLMSNLDLMISMDSSAQHVCSLLGTKVLTIWGATQPMTGFLGYSLSDENVLTIAMDCSPCSVYGNKECYMGDRPCLSTMTAEQIVGKVEQLIGSFPEEQ